MRGDIVRPAPAQSKAELGMPAQESEPKTVAEPTKQVKKRGTLRKISGIIVTLFAFGLGQSLARQLGGSFIVIIAIIAGPFFLAKWLAALYVKKSKLNMRFIEIIAWSNVATWLVPPIGTLTAGATLEVNRHNESDTKKYKFLGYLSLGLAILNGIIGAIIRSNYLGRR